MNTIEGVYRVEMLGPYGWESFATAFIHDGEFRSASAEHFTSGTYAVDEEDFEMEGSLTQYVENRPLFGRTDLKGLEIRFQGTIRDNMIDGEARVVEDSRGSLRFRLARLPVLN